ncbi:hypothetical protein F383_38534 [Gossypium arboreum]|uniref:Uncharacterized protein n=1 Tax=Gossypium arboreum TaxID=29729 RepID=A0A0B0ML48_GOSAR|nr:hypothetical protein F383_38534 [Gossypium arboreum]
MMNPVSEMDQLASLEQFPASFSARQGNARVTRPYGSVVYPCEEVQFLVPFALLCSPKYKTRN